MSRSGYGDKSRNDVYEDASGYFVRDFDLSRKTEFDRPKDHPRDWQEYEFMLGNCCDRLLRDIDDRFKYLSEYVWDNIQRDNASPDLIHRAFQNNLQQIDCYLNLQFDYAKEQLENVMRKERRIRSTPSLESSGFTPSRTSTHLTDSCSQTIVSGSTSSSGSSGTSLATSYGSGSNSSGSSGTDRTWSSSDTGSSYETIRDRGGGDRMSSGEFSRPSQTSSGSSWSSRLSTAEGSNLPFWLGTLLGATILYAVIQFSPPFAEFLGLQPKGQPPVNQNGYRTPLYQKDATNRRKPYDAFWTSCGTSFVDWWNYTFSLLYG